MKADLNQKSLQRRAQLYIAKNTLIAPGDIVFVALSGGGDSIALLEVLDELKKKLDFKLKACHYNHRIRGAAGDADEKFVRQYCQRKNIDLTVGEQPANQKLHSEDDAREARYKFFEKILSGQGREGVKVATAHHMDDVVETYLMRLIRGSGLKGLSSILPRRKNFIRPLLQISKSEILEFLQEKQIEFCQDQSNFDDKFTRNRIRLKLIPELLSYNPRIKQAIVQNAQSIAMDNDLLEAYGQKLFDSMVAPVHGAMSMDATMFKGLHPSLRRRLVILCIEKLGGKDYTFDQIENIIQLIEQNVGKKELPLPHSLRFRLESGKIYLYKKNGN